MKPLYKILGATFFILAIINFSFAATLEETFKKRIPADGKTYLTVYNKNGNINVESWDNDEIEIVAYKKVRASSLDRAKKMMSEFEIEITEFEDGIEVETNYPYKRSRKGGFFSWLFNGGHSNASVEYEIKIPRKLDLKMHTTNGGVHVFECNGKLNLETTNGNIKAEDIAGSVRCKTTNGSIKIYFDKVFPEEDMRFTTTNGSIRLYLPEDTDAEIEARTTNGSIRCDLPIKDTYYKSKRKLEGEINNGGPLLYLKTTNGSIHIYES